LPLNPVRAHMVTAPEEWRWSSYHATVGDVPCPRWLHIQDILTSFHSNELLAKSAFKRFVWEGINSATVWQHLQRQQYLGDKTFVAKMQALAAGKDLSEVPKQARPVPPLEWFAQNTAGRNRAMAAAYASGGYTFAQIGDYFGLHYATVSRLVKTENAS
jgi:putative transposase